MRWTQKPPLGVQINWADPMARGLALCLLFNENSGDRVYDLSGYGNDGTLLTVAFPPTVSSGWNPGDRGPAVALDGTSDYVQIPDTAILDLSECDFTISLRLARTGTWNESDFLIDKESTGWGGWWLWVRSSKIEFGGSGATRVIIDSVPPLNVPVRLTVTYSEASASLKGYLDGILDTTVSENLNITLNAENIEIGRDNNIATRELPAIIDDVRIYKDRALSGQDVLELCEHPYRMLEWPMPWLGAAVAVGVPVQMMHYARMRSAA